MEIIILRTVINTDAVGSDFLLINAASAAARFDVVDEARRKLLVAGMVILHAQANLFQANLKEADLAGASLRGAQLGSADLSGANLEGADLRDAQFSSYTVWPIGFDAGQAGARGRL